MPEIKPFRAIRFDQSKTAGDISAMIAPPYDVLGQVDKDALLKGSARNIVTIDLPHIPPKSAGPAEVYERSARLLESCLADGTMMREEAPSIYLYHQCFEHGGKSYTRRMFIARVRLSPFSEGSILPHELTFGGPKEDRLALMKTTQCNLSPIFGLYADPQDAIGAAFASIDGQAPTVTARSQDVDNRMWVIHDSKICGRVIEFMADRKVYIADGHHRYGTALLYRDWLAEQSGGSLPADHPARYVMFVLASMDDPGCLILPYNRALADVTIKTLLDAWSAGTELVKAEEADIVLYDGATGEETPLRFTNRGILANLEKDQCQPWYDLDAAYLHRYLLDELYKAGVGSDPKVRYVKSAEAAKRVAREESGAALLVAATPMAHLRAVSEAGGLMPQKSTYFHPKLATGMTINPLS